MNSMPKTKEKESSKSSEWIYQTLCLASVLCEHALSSSKLAQCKNFVEEIHRNLGIVEKEIEDIIRSAFS